MSARINQLEEFIKKSGASVPSDNNYSNNLEKHNLDEGDVTPKLRKEIIEDDNESYSGSDDIDDNLNSKK